MNEDNVAYVGTSEFHGTLIEDGYVLNNKMAAGTFIPTLCAAQWSAVFPLMSFLFTSTFAFISISAHSILSPNTQYMSGVLPNLSPMSTSLGWAVK